MKTLDSAGNLLYLNPNEFLEYSCYQDPTVQYNDRLYLFTGCGWDSDIQKNLYTVLWVNAPADVAETDGVGGVTVYADSWDGAIQEFCKVPFFDGKTFWETEKDMIWVK